MKKLLFLPLFLICSFTAFSQWSGTTLDGNSFRKGNVGIGTRYPDHAKLTVNSGGTQVRLENDVLGEEAKLRLRAISGGGYTIHADIGLYATGTEHHQGFLGFKVPHHSTPGSGFDVVINHLGKVGIGTTNPGSLLTIRKTAESNSGHLQFGNPTAVSGEASSTMSLAGWGIQHAGLAWVPNRTSGLGKLYISFGGNSNPYLNSKKVTFQSNGNVGIGTMSPDAPLTVAGNIHAREVKVTATAGGADFVFADDYALPKLEEVDAFVKANKHLPEIPSAAEMEKNGIHLAEMNIKLLQKVEELTLYVIEQQKQAKQAVEKNEELEKRINVADQKVEELNLELQEIKEMIKKKM